MHQQTLEVSAPSNMEPSPGPDRGARQRQREHPAEDEEGQDSEQEQDDAAVRNALMPAFHISF
jgi:hypothetical protein